MEWLFFLRRVGEGLSEAGILFTVFGILDGMLFKDANRVLMFFALAPGIGLFAVGLAMETAWGCR